MSALAAIALLIGGLAIVIAGAEVFFEGLLAGAARLRVSALSLSLVISGFELENLAAGVAANAKGLPGTAAGTFLGGTVFLALGVTGIAAAIAPIRAKLPGRFLTWLLIAPLPLLLLSVDADLSRLDGIVLVVWFVVALVGMTRAARGAGAELDPPRARRRPLLRIVGGLGALTAGGVVLGDGIRRAVSDLGVSQTLLGNTAIAASVEAEEVGRVAVPSRRGRGDVAVANIAGTIVHFAAFNAGVIALVRPLPLDSTTLHFYLPASVAATAVLVAALWLGRGVDRVTGAVMLLLYIAFVAAAVAVS